VTSRQPDNETQEFRGFYTTPVSTKNHTTPVFWGPEPRKVLKTGFKVPVFENRNKNADGVIHMRISVYMVCQ